MTGKFENEDGADKVDDFNYQDLRSLNHWIKFYRKEYGMIGMHLLHFTKMHS